MPINSNNAYQSEQRKQRRLTSQEIWLTNRLNELKATITLQTDQKENQSALQKQNNLLWLPKDDILSIERNITDLNRQINAHVEQISIVQIRNMLKKVLTLPQIEDKPEDISFLEENKQNLRTAIFHYLIHLDPKNSNRKNRPHILSDQKIEALHLLLEIIEKNSNDNINGLVAAWIKRNQTKKSWFRYFDSKKNHLFEDHFLNEIVRALGITKLGELEKSAKPWDYQNYDKIRERVESSHAQALKCSPK